jgi:hypothetical protein
LHPAENDLRVLFVERLELVFHLFTRTLGTASARGARDASG